MDREFARVITFVRQRGGKNAMKYLSLLAVLLALLLVGCQPISLLTHGKV